MAADVAPMAWEALKAAITAGKLPWGQPLLDKLGAFDAVAYTAADAFATAATILKPSEEAADIDGEALKAAHFLGFLLLEWVKATSALFAAEQERLKADAEAKAAAEAAAAEAAAAEAAAAAEGEAAAPEE